MTEADELAQRYLALWAEYVTALLADPRAVATVKRWMSFAGRFSYPEPGAAQPEGASLPAWPPFFGPFGPLPMAPAPADGTAELARRLDELERRITALERRRKPPRVRRGPHAGKG